MVTVVVQRIARILGTQVPVFVCHDALATALQVIKILCLYGALRNECSNQKIALLEETLNFSRFGAARDAI